MKRILPILMAAVMAVCMVPSVAAADTGVKEQMDILNSLKVMTYNPDGDFEAAYSITRAQLAKILVMLSSSRGLAGESSKISPFYDVKYTFWGASYISLASSAGIMYGYSDGSFRPEKAVLFEEAVTAVLRLLGYTSSDIVGSYPQGQLSVAKNIGLLDDVQHTAGSVITRGDMAAMLYNALNLNIKDGSKKFVSTLGYSIAGDELALSDVEEEYIKGPFTVTSGNYVSTLPLKDPVVYLDGKKAAVSDIAQYDIVSYSISTNTVWAYRNKVTGVLQSIGPNKEKPTSISLSGTTYQLSTDKAKAVFGLDGFEPGENITLLLDRDKACADAILTQTLYKDRIGVVLSAYTNSVESDYMGTGFYVDVLLTDNSKIAVPTVYLAENLVGEAVNVTFSEGAVSVKQLNDYGCVSGVVDSAARTIGGVQLSDNCRILDTDEYGNRMDVLLSRLDGALLESDDVLLASHDSQGKTDSMILDNFTGDLQSYGIVTAVSQTELTPGMTGSGNLSGNYSYDSAGKSSSLNTSGYTVSIETGPAAIYTENGKAANLINLAFLDQKVTAVNPLYITVSGGVTYKLSASVLVYDVSGGYSDARLSDIDTLQKGSHTIMAYYDKAPQNGGLIRILCYI